MSSESGMNDLFFERVVLKILLVNQEARDVILPHLTEEVFDIPEHKKFVKIITTFVSKYNSFPKFSDIRLEAEESGLMEALNNIKGIDLTEYTQDSILDKVAAFMRRKLLWGEVVKWVELIKDKKGLDKVDVDKIVYAKNFSFKTDLGTDFLADDGSDIYDELHRKDVFVRTGFPQFDEVLAGGFYKKAMTLMVAGTNCFDGAEEITVYDTTGTKAKTVRFDVLFGYFRGIRQPIFVFTPQGALVQVMDMVEKTDVEKIRLTFSDGHTRVVAKTHRFMGEDGSEVFAKDAKVIKTKSGLIEITSSEEVPRGTVYDIMIPDPHWYVDQFGVIHHNTGKTLFKCNFAKQCLELGNNVLFITLEMPEKRIRDRVVSNILDMSKADMLRLSKTELITRFGGLKRRLSKNLIIKEYGEHELSASKLQVYLKELKEKKKFEPDIVFLDYLGLVTANVITKDANGASQLKRASEEFHAVAKRFNFALVSSMQFNRQGFKKKDPDMDEVSESFATLFTADEVFLITQTPEMHASRRYNYRKVKARTPGKGLSGNFFVNYDKMRLFENEEGSPVKEETKVEEVTQAFQDIIEAKQKEYDSTGTVTLTLEENREIIEKIEDDGFELDI